VWLAGGLRPENAAEAVEAVGPFGLDVCSGLRSSGDFSLDVGKLRAFTAAVSG
jgi:phosphoribosylanthranilate isomerase